MRKGGREKVKFEPFTALPVDVGGETMPEKLLTIFLTKQRGGVLVRRKEKEKPNLKPETPI